MANSYTGTNIGAEGLDKARYQIGDTGRLLDNLGSPIWLLADEEILAAISSNYNEGVATICDGLCARFAQEPDEYTDEAGVKVVWSSRIKVWENLAKRLRSTPAGETQAASAPPSLAYGVMADPSGTDLLGV